jgi:hypothetical protein
MNAHGVEDSKLVLTVFSDRISAEPMINWVRDFQRRYPLIRAGLEELTPADQFCFQMVLTNFHNVALRSGTLATLPEDIATFFQKVKNPN